MKKREILKHFPKAKSIRKEAATKTKQADKLRREAQLAHDISDALDGVVIHNDFPVRIAKSADGVEIRSACDEVRRSAYVKPVGLTKKFVVTSYANNGSDIDGTPVQGEYARAAALRIAKDFVATGKKVKPVDAGITRGRKAKTLGPVARKGRQGA